ncbi:MAG: ATP-binding protein [Treponema sp.]|jgi:DNA polymerase III delta prime subunit|nr:ATP-binding protein [Treponema sp.]
MQNKTPYLFEIEEKADYIQSLLGHIEKIVELSEKKGITESFFEKAAAHISFVTEKLQLTPIQVVLLSHFLNKCDDQAISIEDIAESTKCSKIRIIQYMNEFDVLEKRKLICCCREYKSVSYRVPLEVINALRKGEEPKPDRHENISITEFFTVVENLFDQRNDNELTFDTLSAELNDLIKVNIHLEFCQNIKKLNLSKHNKVLLICFCHLFVNNDDENIGFHDIEDIYEHKAEFRRTRHMLEDGSHTLIEMKFIENTNSNGFGDRESFKLTDKAKDDLLSELHLKKHNHFENKKGIILSESIIAKKLIYNEKETEKIKQCSDLFKEEHFRSVQKRLKEHGLRTGFTCLFSGPPGTGKTETVLQIARETGRDIFQVNASDIKSMWFGESEKMVKGIFDRYREYVATSDIIPILLLNEADGILSRRMEFSDSSKAVDQTENAIQNIILEEFEILTGILIATSNLTKNMDKAFERRFLYKIEFEKPNAPARKAIWQSLIPSLSDSEAEQLAINYDFSGGQIENISRRNIIDTVISGVSPSIEKLRSFCQEELSARTPQKIVGFKQ